MNNIDQPPRLLVIDDNKPYADTIVNWMLKIPARAEAVYSGHEAIQRITNSIDNSDPFQLLILDIGVPREPLDKIEEDFGLKLLTELSSKYPTLLHDIPIIVYTQYADFSLCVKCIKAGAYDYIPKKDQKTGKDNTGLLFDTCYKLLNRHKE